MIKNETLKEDFLKKLDIKNKEILEKINKNSIIKYFETETEIIKIGDEVCFIPIVIEGHIRVFRQDESGKEIFLYYIKPMESCVMSLLPEKNKKISLIKAISSEKTKILLIPTKITDYFYSKYPEWNNFVLNLYKKRFDSLIGIVDQVMFNNMEERIWEFLKKRSLAQNSTKIKITHENIAIELCSAREVISKNLKKLEKKGNLLLKRGEIELIFSDYE
ncbi:MAG: Crp/Fnr family transcriptional regulator [Cyanobacteriota bacterium]